MSVFGSCCGPQTQDGGPWVANHCSNCIALAGLVFVAPSDTSDNSNFLDNDDGDGLCDAM